MIWPILEARAEILQKFRLLFGQWSFKKNCFWDFLTFIDSDVENLNSPQSEYLDQLSKKPGQSIEKQQNPNETEPMDLTKENKKQDSVIIRFKRSSEASETNENQAKKPKIVTADFENNIEVNGFHF